VSKQRGLRCCNALHLALISIGLSVSFNIHSVACFPARCRRTSRGPARCCARKAFGSCTDSPEVRDKLRELQLAQAFFTLELTAELFRLLEHFANASIQVLITKGPALAVRCYGEPGMRQYGDLDLVVREADIRVPLRLCSNFAYEPRISLTAIDARKLWVNTLS